MFIILNIVLLLFFLFCLQRPVASEIAFNAFLSLFIFSTSLVVFPFLCPLPFSMPVFACLSFRFRCQFDFFEQHLSVMQVISLADFTRVQLATIFQSSLQAFTDTVAVSEPTKSLLYFALSSNLLLSKVTTSHGVNAWLDFWKTLLRQINNDKILCLLFFSLYRFTYRFRWAPDDPSVDIYFS